MRLDTKKGRELLDRRPAPYYARIAKGKAIGLRRAMDGTDTWCARFRNDEGRQHYVTLAPLSDAFDYDAALDAATAWFKQLEQGVTGKTDDGKAVTVETACREYVEDRRRQKGEVCANNAASFFERRVYGRPKGSRRRKVEADPLASVTLAKLRKKHVEAWRDRRLEASATKATINRELTHLKAALNLAVSNRLVSAELAREWKDVKPFKKAGERRSLYLDRDQRRALLAHCQGAVRDLVEATMLTGARAGELTSARVSQFDSRQQSITLKGKTGARTVPVSALATELFKRLSRSKLPSAFLLTRDDGSPWGHSGWDEGVRVAADDAKLPKGTCLYTLRHSFITQALLNGMPTLEVSKLVGTSLRMIEEHYGHLAPEGARERLAKVEIL